MSEPALQLPLSYDELVRVSPQGSLFANAWWLEAVAPGQHRILEIRNAHGSVLAAWPIVERETEYGRQVFMPAITQKLGILFAPHRRNQVETQSRNQKLAAQLIDQLGALVSFQQNFHECFADWLPFYWADYAQTTRYTYVLEAIGDIDTVWKRLRPNHRRDIQKARRLGIRIVEDISLVDFIKLNRQTFARQGKEPLASDELIRRIDAACIKHASRKIFAGIDNTGVVHAAVYIVFWNNTAYYLMGGSDPLLRQSGAQLLALWEAIRFASEKVGRCVCGGSMRGGVERVFRGFGATQFPYFAISKQPQPPATLKGFVRAAMQFRLFTVRRRFLQMKPFNRK